MPGRSVHVVRNACTVELHHARKPPIRASALGGNGRAYWDTRPVGLVRVASGAGMSAKPLVRPAKTAH